MFRRRNVTGSFPRDVCLSAAVNRLNICGLSIFRLPGAVSGKRVSAEVSAASQEEKKKRLTDISTQINWREDNEKNKKNECGDMLNQTELLCSTQTSLGNVMVKYP